jgi:hypothetical protein
MVSPPSSRPKRRWVLSGGLATIIAAIIAAAATLHGGSSNAPVTTTNGGSDSVSACNGTSVSGSNNTVNCAPKVATTPSGLPQVDLKGVHIPVVCHPEGESIVLQMQETLKVHVWCSELLGLRHLVETKLKVWGSNPSTARLDVSLRTWFLLVPGSSAAQEWSAPPGQHWTRPRVIRLPGGDVTAIPANPENAAEEIGPIPGGIDYSFATHWTKEFLAPHELWQPPLVTSTGQRDLDGTLVFYVPLPREGRHYVEPIIYGLARMSNGKILTLCPIGSWGRRVSAEAF